MPQRLLLVPLVLSVVACKKSPEAPRDLTQLIRDALIQVDDEPEVLAPTMRQLEAQLYQNMESDSKDTVKRSVEPGPLSEDDVSELEPRPDRDPGLAIRVATVWPSPYALDDHASLPVEEDQRPLEPSSPDHYDREFRTDPDCWPTRDCLTLDTFQDLTKVYSGNIVPPIPYEFHKLFRWIDMNADDEDADGPRWAYLARSWDPDSYSSENEKNWIYASYTVEVWFPRDGRGFTWDEAEDAVERGDDAGDSTGGGTFRFLSLWTDTEIALSDDPKIIAGTIRWGMDGNYRAHDDFLEENGSSVERTE